MAGAASSQQTEETKLEDGMIALNLIPLFVIAVLRRLGRYAEYSEGECIPSGALASGRWGGEVEFLLVPLPSFQLRAGYNCDFDTWHRLHLAWDTDHGFQMVWMDLGCERRAA